MMTTDIARSRRSRRCESCGCQLAKGQPYTRHALPPHTAPNSGDDWWVMSTCGHTTSDCESYWGVDAEEAAARRDGRLGPVDIYG